MVRRMMMGALLASLLGCLHSEAAPSEKISSAASEPGCPVQPPASEETCSAKDLRCTFLKGAACGEVWQCYLGRWRQAAQVECSEANRQCPADSRAGFPGQVPQAAFQCLYASGNVCSLVAQTRDYSCSGVAVRPEDLRPFAVNWQCHPATYDPCTQNWSVAGSPCEPEGQTCGARCCGMAGTCVGGHWQTQAIPCPP